jgi:hypothetical protein
MARPYGWNFPAQFIISHLCSSQFQSFQTFHRFAPFITRISPFQAFQSFNRFAPFKTFQANAGSKRSKVQSLAAVQSSKVQRNKRLRSRWFQTFQLFNRFAPFKTFRKGI